MATTPSTDLICANCHQPAKHTCKDCRLVLYCNRECQTTHFVVHKTVCRSSLIKLTWQPTWWREDRDRVLDKCKDGSEVVNRKYLWGNVPAIDVLNLKDNEGEGFERDLRLLFAASGDLRNVMKMIVELPEGYGGKLGLVVNDKCFDVVARNAIMLLIALTAPESEAISCIIHLWYSAFITLTNADILYRIRPLIEAAIDEVKDHEANTILTKTFTSDTCALRLTFAKSEWIALRSFCTIREDFSSERANRIRKANTLSPIALDSRESKIMYFTGPHRVCEARFDKDGILLPFGHSREEHIVPNPTFFQTNAWPLTSNCAKPTAGWYQADRLKTYTGPATNDVYGKMFCYLKSFLSSFLRRISTLNLRIELYCVDVRELPNCIPGQTFDRVETSNIADHIYVGMAGTIDVLGPLLRKPAESKHATLFTMIMNVLVWAQDTEKPLITDLGLRQAGEWLGIEYDRWPEHMSDMNHPEALKANDTIRCLCDADHLFEEYQKEAVFGFAKADGLHGLVMKESHTTVEKWPLRLKKRKGEPGAEEEFEMWCAGSSDGMVRYAEWHRVE